MKVRKILRSFRNNLGMETIPARVFEINADDPIAALRMEREENEHRKDLTPSEKVELARRIEEALTGRQGQRTDLKPEQLPQNFGEVSAPKERESSAIAAKAVGMNRETYRQAKAVVDSGKQDMIQAMDSGERSINAAYNSIKETPTKDPVPRTIKIILYKNPEDDAEVLLMKGGHDYCTKLAIAILKAAGHSVEAS